MDGSIESRVNHEVENWLRWITRWRPATHRGRARLCRQCFGSPIVASAGLAVDVPHVVQHALSMRIKIVMDASVDEYTEHHLPLLAHELNLSERRQSAQAYRPAEGLDPEFRGLDLDPQPAADAPYLFTFSELADLEPPVPPATDHQHTVPGSDHRGDDPDADPDADPGIQLATPAAKDPLPPLSPEEKAALRVEVGLADEFATQVGRRVCAQLQQQQPRLLAAIAEYVEPQVQALLADLDSTLDSPLWPHNP